MSLCVPQGRTEPPKAMQNYNSYDEYLQAAYEQQADRYNKHVKDKKQ